MCYILKKNGQKISFLDHVIEYDNYYTDTLQWILRETFTWPVYGFIIFSPPNRTRRMRVVIVCFIIGRYYGIHKYKTIGMYSL